MNPGPCPEPPRAAGILPADRRHATNDKRSAAGWLMALGWLSAIPAGPPSESLAADRSCPSASGLIRVDPTKSDSSPTRAARYRGGRAGGSWKAATIFRSRKAAMNRAAERRHSCRRGCRPRFWPTRMSALRLAGSWQASCSAGSSTLPVNLCALRSAIAQNRRSSRRFYQRVGAPVSNRLGATHRAGPVGNRRSSLVAASPRYASAVKRGLAQPPSREERRDPNRGSWPAPSSFRPCSPAENLGVAARRQTAALFPDASRWRRSTETPLRGQGPSEAQAKALPPPTLANSSPRPIYRCQLGQRRLFFLLTAPRLAACEDPCALPGPTRSYPCRQKPVTCLNLSAGRATLTTSANEPFGWLQTQTDTRNGLESAHRYVPPPFPFPTSHGETVVFLTARSASSKSKHT